ncbi:MAG: pseudouridine synthase [Syntrophobacteraceae bacterium]
MSRKGVKNDSDPPGIRHPSADQYPVPGTMRLQKFLAQAGVASRRAAEELIRQGRVEVNGQRAELGCSVDPVRDRVSLDAKPLSLPAQRLVLALHKPSGFVTTASDPQGRRTVLDLIPDLGVRIFPVGRLDYDATGLLLLTNDGELANRLLHPRYGISKVYDVKVKGHPDQKAIEQLRSGVRLTEGVTAPAGVEIIRELPNAAWIRITLHQGWNRQIKRMGQAVGHPVLKISRIAYGPVRLGGLSQGRYRLLRLDEVRKIYEEASLNKAPS